MSAKVLLKGNERTKLEESDSADTDLLEAGSSIQLTPDNLENIIEEVGVETVG